MILFILFWLLCAVATVGTFVPYLAQEFGSLGDNYRQDLGMSILAGLCFGPLALLLVVCISGFWQYGWTLSNRYGRDN